MPDATPCRVLVCTHSRYGLHASSCGARGAAAVLAGLRAEAAAGRLPAVVEEGVCFGYCSIGPNARVVGGAVLHRLAPDDLDPVRAAVAERLTGTKAQNL
ncbi:(2Fe-2S) ferredoxin domain-containing protein [Caenispirillum bisanense]|uniref:(2Fe-2S) ferredoxin domain-containing protein n=1 Tax=Caenispirillum bisanense TaxID=414052 RepID=UPI0031DD6A72